MEHVIQTLWQVLPEATLLAAACLIFLGAIILPRGSDPSANVGQRSAWATAALAALGLAATAWLFPDLEPDYPARDTLFELTPLSIYVRGLVLAGGAVFVLLSWNQARGRPAEFHACLLLILAGTSLAGAANDLVALFLALELISIPTYLLLYLPKRDDSNQEAVTKYFLLSIFSSALVLFGFSYLYGSFGTTNLTAIRAAIQGLPAGLPLPPILAAALVMVAAGFAFRIAAVPFHFYAPDVYQGAPTVGAALLAFFPKLAGFAGLYLMVFAAVMPRGTTEFGGLADQLTLLVGIMAAVSMLVGNFLALWQDNLKRLLAYSSIAHAGYMLIGFAAGRHGQSGISGFEALWFYLVVYGLMTVGAFAILAALSGQERSRLPEGVLAETGPARQSGPPAANRSVENIDDLSGLSRSHPLLALLMAGFLFSLIGLPPTAGFWGKLNLFLAAWFEGRFLFQLLAVLLAINAAIAAYYYLRVVAVMYLRSPVKPLPRSRDYPALVAVAVCALGTFVFFARPVWLQAVAKAAAMLPPS